MVVVAAPAVARGPVAAFKRARELRQVQVQIAEVNTCIAEVTARRAVL